MSFVLTKFCLFLIKVYQIGFSPFLGSNCRFHPTCSAYAATVISRYGPLHGGWLALKRVLKCHPFHSGGNDPPP